MTGSLKNLPADYPRLITDNLEFRREIINACDKNTETMIEVKDHCKDSLLFWVNTFCWTKDPRKSPDVLPFICYDEFQPATLLKIEAAIDNKKDILIEKTRDMGASWMILYVLQHKWLFEDGSDFRIGSRKEDFVDKAGDIDTLMEKLRFNMGKQPLFLTPAGFDWRTHSTYMKMLNPENGNAIVGESANADFGSGGRRKAVMLDEYSKWDDKIAVAAWTATADVTKCRIVVSTPKGSANKFAVLAKGTKERIEKITLHWTLHPEKAKDAYHLYGGERISIYDHHQAFEMWQKYRDRSAPPPLKGGVIRSTWYDAECERRAVVDIAQELDIDYAKSGSPFFDIAMLKRQKVWEYFQRQVQTDPIPYGRYIKVNLVRLDGKVIMKEVPHGWLKVYEKPRSDVDYVVGGDVAEGLPKSDETVGIIRSKSSRDVVAVFNGQYNPDDMEDKAEIVAQFYNQAQVAIENNNHGYSVNAGLVVRAVKLYHTTKISQDGTEKTTKAGWTTDPRSRPLMLDLAAEEIRQESCEVRDADIIAQMETFINNEKGKPEAEGDFLDDCVIAFAIGGAVTQQHPQQFRAPHRRPEAFIDVRPENAGFRFKKRG